MTLDERLTRAAHEVVEGLSPPAVDLDEIRARGRRDRRRRTLLSAAAAATLTALIAVGPVVVNRDVAAPELVKPVPTPVDTVTSVPAPEKPNPFPTWMTPEEVVNEPGAQLQTVAVAPGDPDIRMSFWFLQCTRPCPDRGPRAFEGLALTTDGYATTTYLRPPFPFGVDLHVSSPQDGVFLVIDQSNGGEWLVDLTGTVRKVTHVSREFRPSDPRLWFQCVGRWRSNWCSLDPDNATAYKWPKAWDGSASSPAVVDRPWGANPQPRAVSSTGQLEAWWDTDSGRQLRTLAEVHQGDYILGSPPGEMAYWARSDGADTVDLHTSRNGGADWEVDTREAPGFSDELNDPGAYAQIRRSPDGALLASSSYPRLIVWRAEASGGPFREVYEQSGESQAETSGAGLWTQGDLVYAIANATVAVSDDDGLTWTTIETWR